MTATRDLKHQFKDISICFTKDKFLSLQTIQRHKKCATFLRAIYEMRLQNEDTKPSMEHYLKLLEWANFKKNKLLSLKDLSDQYHHHLKYAGVTLKEHNLLPSIRKTDRNFADEKYPVYVYLDNLRSAYNVGSILRTTEGVGFSTVYFGGKTPYTNNKQVQDSSMDAYKWVHSLQEKDLSNLLKPLIVLETSDEAISLYDFIFPESFTLVLGNEEYGCSDNSLKEADYIITIPMRGRKNSLNVSNAYAIAAGEILRQKTFSLKV